MGTSRTIPRAIFLAAAVAFLAAGLARSHKVYEGDSDFVVMVYERIPEYQLVEYATYGGVYHEDGQLMRHEWAVQQDGKQKCPT